jgi:hypothetical protein
VLYIVYLANSPVLTIVFLPLEHWRQCESLVIFVIVDINNRQADFRYNGTWMVQASVDNGKPIVFVSVK